jgi:hypothetical protein
MLFKANFFKQILLNNISMKRRSIEETLFKFQTVRNLKFKVTQPTWYFRFDLGKGGGGIKVYPPSKFFAKLVNKNVIKHQKGVPSPKNFHNSYIPSLQKFGKNLMDPPVRIFKPCASMSHCIPLIKLPIKIRSTKLKL